MLKRIYKYDNTYLAFKRSKGGKLFKIVLDKKVHDNPYIYDEDNCVIYPVDEVYMQIVINNSDDTGKSLPW